MPDAGLAGLRAQDLAGGIGPGITPIADGIFLSIDPESDVTGRFESPADEALTLDFAGATTLPRWQALHLQLPSPDLAPALAFGLALRAQAPLALACRACLRSGLAEGFHDSFLPRHVLVPPEGALHLDLMAIEADPQLPRMAPWRELVLFFPAEPARITLQDLRFILA